MAVEAPEHRPANADDGGKGLKTGAIGLVSSIVIGVASTAPAYSLAATLGGIVVLVGLQAPAIVLLAFVPILFVSVGYQQLNKREPDCGTTFTWATKAFGPKSGWMGGWGIIAADVLVMASLAQVAGQYVFLLFGAHGIGEDATSGWVLTVGLVWMVLMTYICYRGIEISAAIQRWLLTVEVGMLAIMGVYALIKVYTNHGATFVYKGVSHTCRPSLGVLVQPAARRQLQHLRPGHHPDAVHLLGLGLGGLGQRGDQGPRQDARSRRDHLHGPAARHLRDRRGRCTGVRRRCGPKGIGSCLGQPGITPETC